MTINQLIEDLIEEFKVNDRVSITPETADILLSGARFDRQRNNYKSVIADYANQMQRKEWYDFHDLAIAEYEGNYFLCNGYQRLNAVITCDLPQYFGIRLKRFDDWDTVVKWYSTFDLGKGKNWCDRLRAEGVQNKHNLTTSHINAIIGASKILELKFRYGNKSAYKRNHTIEHLLEKVDFQIDKFVSHITLIKDYAYDTKAKNKLTRSQMLALGYITQADDKYVDFWRGLAADDGLRSGDPRKAFLRKHEEIANRTNAGAVQRELHNIFARCWNAFHSGKDLTNVSNVKGSDLIPIKGTVYCRSIAYE